MIRKPYRRFLFAFGLAAAALTASCTARRDFPEPALGWHTPGFTAVFGRLQKVPGPDPDQPVWTIQFGHTGDPYQGVLALTPPERMVGYSGDERVELHGHMFEKPTTDAWNGRWYVVDSIQMWQEYH